MNDVFRRQCVADASTRMLVHAALLPDAAAWDSWIRWRASIDIQSLKDPSISLLPLVFKRFDSKLKEDSVYPIMKGVYRRTWYKNQMLLDQGKKIAQAMRSGGIETLFLKGAAALVNLYPDPGMRVMKDLDILVPYSSADQAISILESLGFRFRDKFCSFSYARQYTHGAEYFSENLGKIDLHWHAFHDCLLEETDRLFWERSVPAALKGAVFRVPDPVFFLIHTLLSVPRLRAQGDCRWMIDAALVIRQAKETMDWKFLLDFAADPLMGQPLRDTLTYLDFEMGGGLVPETVLENLSKVSASRWQRQFYEWVLDRDLLYGSAPFFKNAHWLWNYYRVIYHKSTGGRKGKPLSLVKGFIPFLEARERVPSLSALIRLGWEKVRKRPSLLWK